MYDFSRLYGSDESDMPDESDGFIESYLLYESYRSYKLNCTMILRGDMTLHATTILCIRDETGCVIIGDGQVSLGNTVFKSTAKKLRRLGSLSQIVAGFAGSAADGITLFERLDQKLQKHSDNLQRACVELTQDWRGDKYLRKLEAMMIVSDATNTFILSGNGDVLEPDLVGNSCICAIGSGGSYALSAALSLVSAKNEGKCNVSLNEIAVSSMKIAARICIFTNENFSIESVDRKKSEE